MTNTPAADVYILIRGRGRVSALGEGAFPTDAESPFSTHANGLPVAALPPATETAVAELRRAHPAYRQLDRTVLLALLAARNALTNYHVSFINQPESPSQNPPTKNQKPETNLAVSIGSSRGATHHLEHYHAEFLREGAVPAAASPLTTLGNVASWVAFDAGSSGAALSHSSTCSSAFQALGNAVAWLKAGLAERFLAGGAEAPLTDFTLAQMQAIGIYSPLTATDWPCRPGAGRPPTFTLGEGAAVFVLEKVAAATAEAEAAVAPHLPLFRLENVGFGFEAIGSKTGISPDGQHFQTAMRQALAQAGREPAEVDALVLHSPGTSAGDAAERAAVRAVFGEQLPLLLSNKWLVGHTLGASAALSLDFALEVLDRQQWPAAPFATYLAAAPTRPIRRILVNAAGFGGNAASALVSLV